MVILGNYKDKCDTATTTANKLMGFDLSAIQCCHLFFFIHNHFCCSLSLSPTKGIEHVEEGDGHVDEDNQGEQRVCKKLYFRR